MDLVRTTPRIIKLPISFHHREKWPQIFSDVTSKGSFSDNFCILAKTGNLADLRGVIDALLSWFRTAMHDFYNVKTCTIFKMIKYEKYENMK